MTPEEIANQKLLLKYYKQQQELKQRRKTERKKKKSKSRKGHSYVCSDNHTIAAASLVETNLSTKQSCVATKGNGIVCMEAKK